MTTGRRLRGSKAPPRSNTHAGIASLLAALPCPASGGAVCVLGIAMMFTTVAVIDVSAHRRDELLQAARIGIAADRIELELSLTPCIAVADDVIGAIDRISILAGN